MTPKPTILVLGAGANVGLSVVQHFHEKGWNVAAAARTSKPELKKVADLVLEADFADVSSIQRVWDETVARLGTPGVVVYNGMPFPFLNPYMWG
jgi:NAD(P)-dependent dehydrogenase (short-subunit alcohol dehydrogenase family)